MPKWSPRAVRAACLPMLAAAALALPASADIFAWRTQDGVFAYTDDPERIPARYADQAVRLEDTSLKNYARLTRTDPVATQAAVAARAQRLEALRRMNGLAAPQATAAHAGAGAAGGTTVTVATRNPQAPTVDVRAADGAEPIVVESVLTKERGSVASRHSTIVRQGDRVLAFIKGRRRHTNPNSDIHDEDDLIE